MFLVLMRQAGPAFDRSKPLDEQSGWRAHAAYMDGLVERGFLVLGGPLPDGAVAHAVEAGSADEVRAAFAADPWSGTHLVVESVQPWTIRLDGRHRGHVVSDPDP